jgi:hypothetical protein
MTSLARINIDLGLWTANKISNTKLQNRDHLRNYFETWNKFSNILKFEQNGIF